MTCPIVPWMKSEGLSQHALAKRLDAPQSSISAYIAGKRGFRDWRFEQLAKLSGIPLAKLIAWTTSHRSRSSH